MKKIIFFTFSFFLAFASFAQQAEATFETKSITRPDIIEGTMDTIVYYFTNTGSIDLKLDKPRGTCGCTVPSAPSYPIKPGQRDSIVATFDSNHRSGLQAKGININSNAGEINLIFEVNVIPKEGEAVEEEVLEGVPHNHKH